MGWLSDLDKGNRHWFSEQWKAVKKDPERLLLGAMTPADSKLWSGITGEDYKPVLDSWGGPSAQVYRSGEEKGINMGPAHNSHRVARIVAASAMMGGAAQGGEGPPGVQSGSANPASFGPGDATGAPKTGMPGMQNMPDMQNMPGMGDGGGQNSAELEKQRRWAEILRQQREFDIHQRMSNGY